MPSSISFLVCAMTLVLGQLSDQSNSPVVPNQPKASVSNLYTQVVAHPFVGLPKPASMKILAPFLSKTLLHRIDLARACEHDFYRQHRDPNLKPPIAWLEVGLFSGSDELSGPKAFAIERTESETNGLARVYVELRLWETSDENPDTRYASPNRPFIWHVADNMVLENGRFVVDDVIYLKHEDYDIESRLSELLAKGCEGTHWIGYRDSN